MKQRPTRIYHYRGRIECGARYAWRDGYSANSATGGVIYPWHTRRVCRTCAKLDGFRAVFFRDGKPE